MRAEGAFRERAAAAWAEIRENLGRSALQALGVMLGVASVLGGFSITDSQRKRADELFVRMGGLDKLNIQPAAAMRDGSPTALQMANRGLRFEDAAEGQELDLSTVQGVSIRKNATARLRSAYADQERRITGIGLDFLPMDGYEVERGRSFSSHDLSSAAPVAILGSEPAAVFFPGVDPIGQTLRVGDTPVVVVGVLKERVFRFRKGGHNIFRWRNRVVALPSTLVQERMQGDAYQRLDRVTFRIPDLKQMATFSKGLGSLLKANHRLQDDFRLDDVAARIRREMSQGQVYDLIFMLAGILALLGGGIVNVNIQMASLKDRVREVGVKMAIGASGSEVFKAFMTEALLLTGLGALAGLGLGVGFSRLITSFLGIPLFMRPASFVWAFALATACGFLFALFPAWKASRLSPMEALRYE